MIEPDANSKSGARVSGKRRFRGVAYALVFVVGCTIIVAAFLTYKDYASRIAQMSCLSNLKQLSLAIQKYHEQNGSYPPAYVKGKDGKPAHSWRVLILPFLGRQDLYDAYHFDEPWDSPSNQRLVDQMPDVFACPGSADRARKKTSYVAVVGSQTIWPGDRAPNLDELNRADGPSTTILLIEIADSDIAWTEPRDVRMD